MAAMEQHRQRYGIGGAMKAGNERRTHGRAWGNGVGDTSSVTQGNIHLQVHAPSAQPASGQASPEGSIADAIQTLCFGVQEVIHSSARWVKLSLAMCVLLVALVGNGLLLWHLNTMQQTLNQQALSLKNMEKRHAELVSFIRTGEARTLTHTAKQERKPIARGSAGNPGESPASPLSGTPLDSQQD